VTRGLQFGNGEIDRASHCIASHRDVSREPGSAIEVAN